ncbi:hypothetical protein N5J77_21075 [Sphingobium yanoikuyae]|uniref:Uncharacterized protein n=2 Tax=Sphingobium TaxID=165695 RepID=A0AA43BEC6_SPHYA|nr:MULTISPECIES: hypothetical protein [Sphingobium]MBB4148067.1 hypothetical protein [Sphingobium scionense]MDH2133632.1 hypothetical protein [Sphingobium yanoikuyae]MDH2151548.1 hypothetical protein [Sphingobium yanoikuyae]MDH2168947.1 hypothetical protein [Sphingobium yanoikuyae]
MEKGDDAAPPDRLRPANDNEPAQQPPDIDVEAALTRIAEAIGRHIAREHIRAWRAANDNEPETSK